MAKKFQFDDENDDIVEVPNTEVNTLLDVPNELYDEEIVEENKETIIVEDNSKVGEESFMAKVKKKLKIWHIILLVIILMIAVFFGYIFLLTNNDGPVFGNRCEGVTAINEDAKTSTIAAMKDKYSDITDLTIEVVCREVKVDIVFKDKMNTKTAKSIAEEVVKTLDKNVGLEKENGNTYSQLFGYINNEAQYDCQLYLLSENSKDFPIYATKHHSLDKFSYTYASVKDEDSKNKAEATLEENKDKEE